MYKYEDIKTIHLEVTQNCQASCPMCARNQNGGFVNPHIDLSELTLEDCKAIFEPDFIKQLGNMYMCGNLGDPIIARDTLEIFRYFRKHNSTMWLSMNTNAGARDDSWWEELANTLGRRGSVIFSVDGLEDTNHIYRQDVNWKSVRRSMQSFISAGGRAYWDFLIFEHNQHQVGEAEQLSKEWGFERFRAKKTGRFVTPILGQKENHQAFNKKGEITTNLKKPEEQYQNAVFKKHNELAEKYGSIGSYYDVVSIDCKVKKEGSLFISAEGLTLPCCWTAARMYNWYHKDPRVEQIWNFIDAAGGKEAISAKINGIKKVFETGIFDNIEKSWSMSSCKSGKLQECARQCGVEFDLFKEQFK
jgi:MoaA/NifB/PqqE/SkfB family radical SAM enzyme